jgi:hypothetical protein
MTPDVENNEWKAEAPYLASLPRVNPFCVPEQYFAGLPAVVKDAVYVDRLKQEITTAGFIVPEDYFSGLKERISAETNSNLRDLIPQAHGYNTPDHYFEKLQANILAKTTAETIPLKKGNKIVRLWHSGLLKYASAACFILVTAFGLYLNQQNYIQETRTDDIANEQLLYDIDEQDIIDHVRGTNIEEEKADELETYILNNYTQNDLSSNL